MITEEELSPCPFCGSVAEVECDTVESYYVKCCASDSCNAIGPERSGKDAAIRAWNARGADAVGQAAVAWAEAIIEERKLDHELKESGTLEAGDRLHARQNSLYEARSAYLALRAARPTETEGAK